MLETTQNRSSATGNRSVGPAGRRRSQRQKALAGLALAAASLAPQAVAQSTDGLCTVSILNQTAYVQTDGTWLVPNVPANMGPVRARVTCVADGGTVSGESELFSITADRQNSIPVVPLGETSPAPVEIELAAPVTTLNALGASVAVSVTVHFDDGSTVDVSSAADGVIRACEERSTRFSRPLLSRRGISKWPAGRRLRR